ncbi:hypothetical protein [Roseomonas sp. BN140053]|uniref:hypothetical protein n=1 Tax=Roseomonas sp. BN140053 TaxID=3391898 RepID=UPI0039E884B4
MQIRVDTGMTPHLEDTDDLKRFKLVMEAPRTALPQLRDALDGVLRLQDDAVAWVSRDWLLRNAPRANDPAWQEGWNGMLAVAQKYGWIEADTGDIRAHIEWTAPS